MSHLRPRVACATTGALAITAFALPAAVAQGAGSGLAISPPIIEHLATAGAVGTVTVSNATGQTMKITVSAHPWLQYASGAVSPNPRQKLGTVSVSPASFSLPSGSSQQVSVGLGKVPAAGSLYGNVDVLGVPTTVVHKGVNVDYRLIGTLRLDPAKPRYGARTVKLKVLGTHRNGEITVDVRNTGNTVAPISGTVTLRGAVGSVSGRIAPVRIVPGVTVDIPTLRLHGTLPAGAYTLKATLKSSGAKSHATFHLKLR